jgi:cell shape-determining protein MreD
LYCISAYLALFGVMFLFAPSVAERITHTTHDATLNVLYGQYTMTFALVAFMAARKREPTSELSLVVLVLTAGHVMVFSYLLINGIQDFSQAGVPLIVNSILAVLLFLFRKSGPYAA